MLIVFLSTQFSTHPNYTESILNKEVEQEGDHTDEGEDGYARALASLCLVQLLLGHIPALSAFRLLHT